MAHPVEEVGLHLVCTVRARESLLKGLLLARLILDRVVDVHEHAHARARNALIVAPELRGGADPHALAVLAPHAVVDVVRTALRCGDAELVVDAGKVIGGDEPVRVLAVFGEAFAAFEAEDAAALVGEPESRGIAFVVEVSGPAGGMQKTASVSHFLFEGALGNSALLLLYFDFRLGERCVRRSSSMSSRSRSLRSATPAKSKGDEASPFPDLAFAPSFMFAPQSSADTSHFRMALTKSRRRAEPSAA